MPKCKVCGTRLAEGVAKCPNCGAAAGSTVSGTVSPSANLQKSVCPACNKQILGEHKYCPNCGTNLNSASARTTNNIQQNPAIQQMTQTRTQTNGQELVSDNSHKNKNETEKQQSQSNAQTKQQKSVQKQLSGKYIALKVMQLLGYITLIGTVFTLVAENAYYESIMTRFLAVGMTVMILLVFIVALVIFKHLSDLSSGKKSPSFAREFLLSLGAIIGFIMFYLILSSSGNY